MKKLKVTPAGEFRGAFRKLVELPSGRVVEVRKITVMTFLRCGLIPPEVGELDAEVKAAIRRRVLEDPARIFRAIVVDGVIRPKVADRPHEELGENEVHVDDFGDDLLPVVEAILEFSGFGGLAAEDDSRLGPFRREHGPGPAR